MEDLRFYIVYLALFAGIIGFIFLNKLPTKKARSLLVMIWFSAFTEFAGIYYTSWTNQLNYIVFNIYIIVSLTYYMLLLRKLLESKKYKKIAFIFTILFLLFFISNELAYQHFFVKMDSKSFALGIIFIVILSCRYLFEIVNSNKILDFQYSIFFWFVIGILLFNVPFLPFMLSEEFFLIDYNQNVTSLILFFLNLFMYCCIIIGFIWSEKKYNY